MGETRLLTAINPSITVTSIRVVSTSCAEVAEPQFANFVARL